MKMKSIHLGYFSINLSEILVGGIVHIPSSYISYYQFKKRLIVQNIQSNIESIMKNINIVHYIILLFELFWEFNILKTINLDEKNKNEIMSNISYMS